MTCGIPTCTFPAKGNGDPMCSLHAGLAGAIAQNRRVDIRDFTARLREQGLPIPERFR